MVVVPQASAARIDTSPAGLGMGQLEQSWDGELSMRLLQPFTPAAKREPLGPGRARYTRHYSYSVTDFAMRAFLLGEQLKAANEALQENCRFYTENAPERNDRDSFYWASDVVCRMVELFGSRGSIAPGRLAPETESAGRRRAGIRSASPESPA